MKRDFGTRTTGSSVYYIKGKWKVSYSTFIHTLSVVCQSKPLLLLSYVFFLVVEDYIKGWTIIQTLPSDKAKLLIVYHFESDNTLLFSKKFCKRGIWAYRVYDVM